MEVELKRVVKLVYFNQITVGSQFIYQGSVYVRVQGDDDVEDNATILNDASAGNVGAVGDDVGRLFVLSDDVQVEPRRFKLVEI